MQKEVFTKNGSMKRYQGLEVDFDNKFYWRNKLAEQKVGDEERRQKRVHERYCKQGREHEKEPHRMSRSFGKKITKEIHFLDERLTTNSIFKKRGKVTKYIGDFGKRSKERTRGYFSACVKSFTTKEKRTRT